MRPLFGLLFLIGWCFSVSLTGQAQQMTTITIDPTQRYQTLEGFGASGAWWAQAIGGWSDENRQRVVDLLFSPDPGTL
jgi:hypothetical protein